jgi:hypothetical protein
MPDHVQMTLDELGAEGRVLTDLARAVGDQRWLSLPPQLPKRARMSIPGEPELRATCISELSDRALPLHAPVAVAVAVAGSIERAFARTRARDRRWTEFTSHFIACGGAGARAGAEASPTSYVHIRRQTPTVDRSAAPVAGVTRQGRSPSSGVCR